MKLGDLTALISRYFSTTGLQLGEQRSELFGPLLPLLALAGGAEFANSKAYWAPGTTRGES